MKKNPAHAFQYAITGIGYGIPATLLCMTLIGGYKEPIGELVTWTLASALIGLLSGFTFDSEKLTLPAALGIHCTGTLLIAVAAATICGYSDNPVQILSAVFPVFVIIYAIIYGINCIVLKQMEKEVNEVLEQKR